MYVPKSPKFPRLVRSHLAKIAQMRQNMETPPKMDGDRWWQGVGCVSK
ncbi:hypothetical protein [Geitlerinema sp. PCC 9228]|nr:hypothetical protein [Geitlerinema sp. PCC 9228]